MSPYLENLLQTMCVMVLICLQLLQMMVGGKITPGYKQHLNYASLRAIECRRAIARSANTGISTFIDCFGTLHKSTKWNEAIAIKDIIMTNTTQTIYVQFGDYIGRISAFLAILFLCFAVAKRDKP